jgi:hypothetical protein
VEEDSLRPSGAGYFTSRYLRALAPSRRHRSARSRTSHVDLSGTGSSRTEWGDQLHAHSEAVGDEVASLEVPLDDEFRSRSCTRRYRRELHLPLAAAQTVTAPMAPLMSAPSSPHAQLWLMNAPASVPLQTSDQIRDQRHAQAAGAAHQADAQKPEHAIGGEPQARARGRPSEVGPCVKPLHRVATELGQLVQEQDPRATRAFRNAAGESLRTSSVPGGSTSSRSHQPLIDHE